MSINPKNYNPYITIDYVETGGVQILLGDGSVRFLSPSIGTVRSNVFAVWLTTGVAGTSSGGADQLVRAEIITSSGDRRAVANAILRKMGFADPLTSWNPKC